MYKFLSVILSLVILLLLSACGGADASQASSAGGDEAAGIEVSLSGEIGGEITISIYDSMKYKVSLEDTARQFEEKYPGTAVKVVAFSAMPEIKTADGMVMVEHNDDPQGRQDYISQINTDLMSGGGADILAMDVLPFYKYADSGQLENLAAYMQADPSFDKADYRTNIIDAVEYKGGTWFLPMDYSFTYYTYDSALLAEDTASGFGTGGHFTAEELIKRAEPAFDGSAPIFNQSDYDRSPRSDMWDLLLEENYTSFVDIENKKANFNDGGFAALLESVKQYAEQGYIPKAAARQADAGTRMQKESEGSTGRFFFKPQNVVNLISFYTRHLNMKMTAMAEGGTMAIGDDDEIAGIASGKDGTIPFTYEQAYGINANSKNKETAWAFLRFLLSEEMQLNTNLSATTLPLSNAAREKKMEIMLASVMEQQGQTLTEAQHEAIAMYNDAVERFSDQIDVYVIRDTMVDDMIAAEVRHFFEGTKTADDVADILQSKVDLYLNE